MRLSYSQTQKRVQIAEPSVHTVPPIIPPPAAPPWSPCMPDTASTSEPAQGRSRTRCLLPEPLVSRAILAWNLCSRLSLPDRGRSRSPSVPGGRVEVQRGTLPGARADRAAPQYFLLSGIAPLTPPRGSSTSPAYRGMRWTWRCITVWPAAFPTFTPML